MLRKILSQKAILELSNEYEFTLKERDVVEARFIKGLSYREIAGILDIEVGAVHKRMGQVYKKLEIEGRKGKETQLRKIIENRASSYSTPLDDPSLLETIFMAIQYAEDHLKCSHEDAVSIFLESVKTVLLEEESK